MLMKRKLTRWKAEMVNQSESTQISTGRPYAYGISSTRLVTQTMEEISYQTFFETLMLSSRMLPIAMHLRMKCSILFFPLSSYMNISLTLSESVKARVSFALIK